VRRGITFVSFVANGTARSYAFVWEQTRLLYRDMISEEGWTGKNIVEVPAVQKLTFNVNILS
jgi:hypothetical protein